MGVVFAWRSTHQWKLPFLAVDFHFGRFLRGWALWEQNNHRNTGRIQMIVVKCMPSWLSLIACVFTAEITHYHAEAPLNGYCHFVCGFYSVIVVCTDYMEHTDVVSVQLSHFQVCIGTCKFFYFAFSGLTSDIDALTKLQYALWNKDYKIHLPCL